jgi:hypothetical protein
MPVWTTLVTWVLIKISKFDLDSAGVRYAPEALLLLPPPIENWAQPYKCLVAFVECKRARPDAPIPIGSPEFASSLNGNSAICIVVLKIRESRGVVS